MTKACDIMTSDPVCVRPEDSAQTAAQIMRSQHVGPVPVVDHQNRLVGIVTDRDLAIKVVAEGRNPRSTKVAEVMSRDPYTATPNADVELVIQTMEEHQVRRVPITEDDRRLIGIVSQADVATRMHQPAKVAEIVEEISCPSVQESR
jgi:CBS domain-containing protein